MAYEQTLTNFDEEASADLSGEQYRFVKVGASGLVVAGAGEDVDGVLQNKPGAAGRMGTVAFSGITKMRFGGTVAKGADVAADASGDAVAAGSGATIVGRAIVGGAAGQIGSVLLKLGNAAPPV